MNFLHLINEASRFDSATVTAKRLDGQDVIRTFPELVADVQKLASTLAQAGLEPGMRIALQSSNCYEYIIWDLAATSLGAVIQAFPEDLPVDRLTAMAARHEIALWLCEKGEHAAAFANGMSLADAPSREPLPINLNARPVGDADIHSLVYSSGTSGHIKGLVISRNGTEALVTDFIEAFALDETDSHLIFLPLSNYQQRLSVYGCLWSGASFMVTQYATVLQDISCYSPTFIIAPPAIYENVYNVFGRGSRAYKRVNAFLGGDIRFMITGMAPIRKDVMEGFNALGFPLLEAYGVTETGMIAWNTLREQRIGSVGRPIHPERVYFTNDSEIVIRSPQPLSKGYFDCAGEDSAATYLPDGAIATGDIGTIDADGFLRLMGRKKEIILTSGGAKFHPEEMESALLSLDQVKHAVVIPTENHRLVAVLVVDDCADPVVAESIENGIRCLNASVPDYKNIHHRILTDIDPTVENGMLTRNLKCDRKGVYRFFQAQIEGA